MAFSKAPPQDAPAGRATARSEHGTWLKAMHLVLAVALTASCGDHLDVGRNVPRGKLPDMDERSPVILINDSWEDNWSGEFAALFANTGGPPLAGIIVNATRYWPNGTDNETGWKDLVSVARNNGLQGIPDPVLSTSEPFVVPADRRIESTPPNESSGAQLILQKSRELSQPWQPLVVIACSRLTDVADAYLMDPSVVDRVVVLAQLGSYSAPKGAMTGPNGDLDPWADWIVAQKFRYTQVSAYYDQLADVTEADIPNLPHNGFGKWMEAKQPKISWLTNSSDQEPVLALAAPEFIAEIITTAPDTSAGFNSPFGQGPPLVPNPNGNTRVISQVNPAAARVQLWELLNQVFGP